MPIVPWMSCAQAFPCSLPETVCSFLCRLGKQAYSCGAISRTERLLIHLSSQKRAVRPSPRDMVVEAKNRLHSSAENCRSRLLQARFLSVQLNQIQRRHRASPVLSKSGMPSPPNLIGRQVRRQLTWQLPPLAASRPTHRNPLLIFSSYLMVLLGGAKTNSW